MPRMRIAQLASTPEPGATLFHAPLDWPRLPRLSTAIDRLFATLVDAGVDPTRALGAPSSQAFRARTPTVASLYERTHYGSLMPLLYGYPADVAYFHSRGLDVTATIDRYFTTPITHELCHFAPDREAFSPPHLDECIAGWLGVHVHPEFAYPEVGYDDAIYAAPWLSQVGQAIARAFGIGSVIRAHAGTATWDTALPAEFVETARRLGWEDWRARRTLHFLSDTLDPAPWVALALLAGAGKPLAGHTLATLAAAPLAELALPEDPRFDLAIVTDALRAMSLDNACIEGSFRARSRVPEHAIEIDPIACRVTTERARSSIDPVAPSYWLPPAIAQRMAARGIRRYELRLCAIAAIPAAAAAIFDATPSVTSESFALVAHP
ncbi:MAG: hypothetical protein JWO36_1589 [Myxococcales bacterium]|nr:hypothetical protein [Myxococcales bacterium]